jgi:positive regulator of sigma E activity
MRGFIMEEYFMISLVGILVCAAMVSRKKKSVLDWTLAAGGLFIGLYLVADLWRFSFANEPFWIVLATLAFIAAVAWGIRQHFRRRRNRHNDQPNIHIHNYYPPN